jgi:hypothetical protein
VTAYTVSYDCATDGSPVTGGPGRTGGRPAQFPSMTDR